MNTYLITVLIYKGAGKAIKAIFELDAKDEDSAKYRVIDLLSEETRKDGDGYEISSVSIFIH